MNPTWQSPDEQPVRPRNTKRWASLLIVAILVALALLIAGVIMAAFVASKLNSSARSLSGADVLGQYPVTKIATTKLPTLVSPSTSNDHLLINAQVQVSSGLTLTPSVSAPLAPTIGEFYYDQSTDRPYYYNGKTFVPIQPAAGSVQGNTFVTNVTNLTNNFISGGGTQGSFVSLQAASPGSADTGNFNISGTGIAATLEASTIDTVGAIPLSVGSVHATAIDLDKPTLVKADSLSALQVQSSAGAGVLTVDTVDQFLGIATASPTATLEADVNNTSSSTPIALFSQNGSGNASIDLITPAQGWAAGVDAGNNNAFEINSSTVGAPSIGHVSPGAGNDPGVNDTMACNEYTALDNGSALSMTVMTGPSSLPPVSPFDKFSMALYDGTAGGPVNLIARTISGTLPTTVSTRTSLPITANLTAGSIYWLCVNTNVITSTSYASDTVAGGSYWFHSQTYGSGWPAVAPSGGTNIANFEAVLYLTYKGGPTLNNSIFSLSSIGQAHFHAFNDTTDAFQIQNASGAKLFTADTLNGNIVLGNDGAPSALTVRGGAATGNNAVGGAITFDASNGTGAAGSGDLIFRTAAATGAIALDNTAHSNNGGVGATDTITNFTVGTESNMVMVVGVNSQSGTVSSISWNGTTTGWTKVDSQLCPTTVSPGCDLELWYLVGPTSGTHNLIVTITGQTGNAKINAGASTFYNVNPATPIGVSSKTANAATTQTTTSLNLATSRGQIVVDVFGNDPSSTISPAVPQTQLWSDGISGGSYKVVVDPTTNMGWKVQAADWATVAASLNPAANTTTGTLADRLHIASNGDIGINTSTPQQVLDVQGSGRFQVDSTEAFQVQDVGGTPLLIADTVNMVLTVTTLKITTLLTVDGHIVTGNTSGNTIVAAGANAGTGASVVITGDDTSGKIVVTTGTGSSAGDLADVSFASAYVVAPNIVMMAGDPNAAKLQNYVNPLTTGFSVRAPTGGVGLADGTSYTFYYQVLQ